MSGTLCSDKAKEECTSEKQHDFVAQEANIGVDTNNFFFANEIHFFANLFAFSQSGVSFSPSGVSNSPVSTFASLRQSS